jgi:hypothetical protein
VDSEQVALDLLKINEQYHLLGVAAAAAARVAVDSRSHHAFTTHQFQYWLSHALMAAHVDSHLGDCSKLPLMPTPLPLKLSDESKTSITACCLLSRGIDAKLSQQK